MRTARSSLYGGIPDRDPHPDRDPLDRTPTGQRPPHWTETPLPTGQRPLDRDPSRRRLPWTENPRRNMRPGSQTRSNIIQTPSPVDRITDMCKTITLPQISFPGDKYCQSTSNIFSLSFYQQLFCVFYVVPAGKAGKLSVLGRTIELSLSIS